jgi:signal transduction histidine kinase
METGARQIRSIVQEVKAFAHPAGAPTELVEVAEVVDAAMRMSGPAIRAKGKLVREDGGTPRVNAASNRLAQVFLNLLVNAADALPAAKHSTNQVRVSVDVDAAGWARVVIADNGPGIPPEVLAKLFTPFFTTKAPGAGTGLGLWICRSIVDGFGGRIEVDSAVDKGTTFRVLLPQSNTR